MRGRWFITTLQGACVRELDVRKEGRMGQIPQKLSKSTIVNLLVLGGYSLLCPWLFIWSFLLLSSLFSVEEDTLIRKLCDLGKSFYLSCFPP